MKSTMIRRVIELCLVGGPLLALGACSATADPSGTAMPDAEIAASSQADALLADVSRCAAGRFDTTLAHACSVAGSPKPLTARLPGFVAGDFGDAGPAYGVRLGDAGEGKWGGTVNIRVPEAGEYVVYLGSPNVPLRVKRPDGAAVTVEPICGRYLPLAPAPAEYTAACSSQLLGASALELERGGSGYYQFEFGPAENSWVRMVVVKRRALGVTIDNSEPECDLSSTLATACAAGSETPVRGKSYGSAPLLPIASSSSYGVHLTALGAANEGAVSFTPPYTADYTVYVGTPRVGVSVLDGTSTARRATCATELTDAICPKLRAAFTFSRLQGGLAHQLELGRLSPEDWVRTIVIPTSPDTDGDGLADSLDRCPTEPAATECGCASCEVSTITVQAGARHTCALKDGRVRCWGDGQDGKLGYGNRADIGDNETPAMAGDVNVGGRVVQLATASLSTCVLLDTGAVRCWGYGGGGALGYGNTISIGDNEAPATAGDVNVGGRVVQLAAGASHVCALLDTGAVRCWGSGFSGELGYGNTNSIGDNETPASAGDVDVGGRVVQLTAGAAFTCALLDTGAVRCWGHGVTGVLGHGNTNNIGDDETPASAGDIDVGGRVVQVEAGSAGRVCVLLDTAAVRCWGSGRVGGLGYGNTNTIGDNEAPASAGNVQVGGRVVQLAAGWFNCALLDSGAVRCWGAGDFGLGYGNTNTIGDDETPATVGEVNVGGRAVQVTAGGRHACAVLTSGGVRCWGDGADGVLGYGNTNDIGDNELPASAGEVSVF